MVVQRLLVDLAHLCLRYNGFFVEHFERLSERDCRTATGSQNDDQKQLTLNEHSGGSRILCLGGLMGRVFLFGGGLMGIKRRRRETAIAEGKKSLTTRSGAEPQKPTQF